MTLTQLTVAIDAYLLLNPLDLNKEVIMEGTNAYSTVATSPTLDGESFDGVVVIKRLGNYGS